MTPHRGDCGKGVDALLGPRNDRKTLAAEKRLLVSGVRRPTTIHASRAGSAREKILRLALDASIPLPKSVAPRPDGLGKRAGAAGHHTMLLQRRMWL
jgi:hypothetical protein